MKRKFLVVFLATLATLCITLSFAGCSFSDIFGGKESGKTDPPVVDQDGDDGKEQGNTPAPHIHSYSEWKVTKEATCKEEGIKERECACGEKETATYLTKHDFENMTCKVCGTKASLGLKYILINEDKEYEVSGIGYCRDADLIITNNYEGKPVTSIGNWAFEGYSLLTSIDIPNSVTSIGGEAFSGCDKLTSINIPNSVTAIGWGAFAGCSGLTSIDIPDSVTEIGGAAFYNCSGLQSVTIGSGVTEIGEDAFYNCNKLKEISIPNNVTSIGNYALMGCSGLQSVTIGSGVTKIEMSTFVGCSGLEKFIVDTGNTVYSSQDGVIYDKAKVQIVFVPIGIKGTLTLPDSVTSIGAGAFGYCDELTSITIPDSVTSIGAGAFDGCSGLTSVTIGSGVTEIGDEAFRGCEGLQEVHITDLAAWCGIEFGAVAGNPLIYAHHLFMDGKEITKLKIPNKAMEIKEYAFWGCSELTSITIPDRVTEIGMYAFSYCSRLTSITIGRGVTSIGGWAFAGCNELSEIKVDANNQVFYVKDNCLIATENKTFCVGCKTSKIPDDGSVTGFGMAFSGYSWLISIDIPDCMTKIGIYAFSGCSELTSVTIPDSVTSIGWGAFLGCSNLQEVHFENPNGWEAGNTPLSGLEDPATAAKYLTDTYEGYYWNREG